MKYYGNSEYLPIRYRGTWNTELTEMNGSWNVTGHHGSFQFKRMTYKDEGSVQV